MTRKGWERKTKYPNLAFWLDKEEVDDDEEEEERPELGFKCNSVVILLFI